MTMEVLIMSDFYLVNIETGEYTEKVILDITTDDNAQDDEAITKEPKRQD